MLYVYSSPDTFILPILEPEVQEVKAPIEEQTMVLPTQAEFFDVKITHDPEETQQIPAKRLVQEAQLSRKTQADQEKMPAQEESMQAKFQVDLDQPAKPKTDWIGQIKQVFSPEPNTMELYWELNQVSKEIEQCRSVY